MSGTERLAVAYAQALADLAELRAELGRLAEELAHERSLRGYTNRGSIADASWRGLGTW